MQTESQISILQVRKIEEIELDYLGHSTLHSHIRIANCVGTLQHLVDVICVGKCHKAKASVTLLAIGSILGNVSILQNEPCK